MKHNIHESIASLACPVDNLVHLQGNPRIGNIDAIAASYEEFGQVRPIVVRPNDDGTSTVIAGNHQLEAARRLGWTHIAVVEMDADDSRAMAFAIADNRTNELGHTDDSLLHAAMEYIIDDFGDLLEDLGWDEFELAMLDLGTERGELATPGVYEQPILRDLDEIASSTTSLPTTPRDAESPRQNIVTTREDNGDITLSAPKGTDIHTAVTQGSGAVGAGGATKSVVQYTLVFDDAAQQRKWYDFLRWLRSDPAAAGETTAAKLIDFIEQHTP
jgi:hypothetical protein